MVGESHHTQLISVVFLGYGVVNLRIDITSAVGMTASDSVFDSRCGFSGSTYPVKT